MDSITFKDRKLAKICNSEQKLNKRFGTAHAKKIKKRLTELQAADNLEVMRSLPNARLHPLRGNREGQFAVDTLSQKRLVFVLDHDLIPKKENGEIDLIKITRIKILGVIDYHG